MRYYVGLDVSVKLTAVCIVDADGAVVREALVDSDPAALAAFLVGTGLSFSRIGLEDFSQSIGRPRTADEPAPAPCDRPENVVAIERAMGFEGTKAD